MYCRCHGIKFKKNIYTRDPESIKIEEVLQLEHLKKLRTIFSNRRSRVYTELEKKRAGW